MSTPPDRTGVREIPESSRVSPRLDPLPFAAAAATVAAVIITSAFTYLFAGLYNRFTRSHS